mmetsp:Transcript_13222/g.20815  ORF Transcript_13222/g.20815 Transcript_13222/m.20815 type:complete len:96 (+) Transcript_13222:1154-1441(+)
MEHDQEEDAYEQGYEAGVADDQQDYALSAMAPCRAAALGACFRDIAGFDTTSGWTSPSLTPTLTSLLTCKIWTLTSTRHCQLHCRGYQSIHSIYC